MAFQPVPDGIEVVFDATQNGVPVVNVFNVKATATHDEEFLSLVGAGFIDAWRDELKPNLHNSYVLGSVKVTSLELDTGPQVIIPLTTDNQGDLTGAPVAGNACAVISWRTASIGRSFRGRTYIGGLAEIGLVNAQFITGATQTVLAGFATHLIDALEEIGCVLAVLSRVTGGAIRAFGILTEIVSVIVDAKIDSQRRRTAN